MKKYILILSIFSVGLLSFKAADDYFEISKNLDIFASVYKEVHTSYVDEVKPGELIRAAINGMLRSLDPYTVFYSEAQAEDYRYEITGTYAGIGSTTRSIKDRVVFTSVKENFPAHKAGLRPGDIILTVDGISMEGKATSEVSEYLRGKAGTSLQITVERPSVGTLDFSLEREQIKDKNVPYFDLVDAQTGFIKLTGFTPGAANEVNSALQDLKKRGANRMILDLRGNGGGLLNEAIAIVNIFIDKGVTVVTTKAKNKEEDRIYKTLNRPTDTSIPLVVLIDGRSASASEIVSGALQDLDRAVIIGRNSFGKGLVQGTRRLTYNTQMKVTIAKYFLPSGRLIQRLDYADKVNGRAQEVADSTKKTFLTSTNRPVIDGEGIHPDKAIDMLPYSRIAESLLRNNLLFDFACNFRNKTEDIGPARDFDISDALYTEFKQYLSDKDYEYKTDSERELEKLEKTSEREKLADHLASSIATLRADIASHKANALDHHDEELREALEYEIANCYYMSKGRVEISMDDDPDLAEAQHLFNTSGAINAILGK